jgi:dUTP pyrophosphatase
MNIRIKRADGLAVPKTGTDYSAGYDLVAMSDPIIVGKPYSDCWESIDYIEYKTGVCVSPQTDEYGRRFHTHIYPRSSLSNYNLVLSNSVGTIDNDYRGEISFRFRYIMQPEDIKLYNSRFLCKINESKIYKKGDRIGQLIASETNRMTFEEVDDLDATVRGANGYGSSGQSGSSKYDTVKESTAEGTLDAFKTIVEKMPDGVLPYKAKDATSEAKVRELSEKFNQLKEKEIQEKAKVFDILALYKQDKNAMVTPKDYETLMKERDKA